MSPARPLFIDTWGWFCLYSRRSPEHERCRQTWDLQEWNARVTTTFALAEAFTLFRARLRPHHAQAAAAALYQDLLDGAFECVYPGRDLFDAAYRLMARFSDHPKIGFVDFVAMAYMQQARITDILTDDKHFREVNLGFVLWPAAQQAL